MINKTAYYNLDKPDKGTINWHENLNGNFDKIDTGLYNQYSRLNTIITTPIDSAGSAEELIDARNSSNTLGERLDGIDSTIADVQSKAVRKDIADSKTGDLIMITNSGIVLGGRFKFSYNVALDCVDINVT